MSVPAMGLIALAAGRHTSEPMNGRTCPLIANSPHTRPRSVALASGRKRKSPFLRSLVSDQRSLVMTHRDGFPRLSARSAWRSDAGHR